MKQFIDYWSIQIHEHFEKLLGTAVGVGTGVSEVSANLPDNSNLLEKVVIVALYAFIGGIFGGLAKWAIEWLKNKIIEKYNERKRES